MIQLRAAWEAGFVLCRSYGDNWIHFNGEQKERHWRAYLAGLPAPQTDSCIIDQSSAFERFKVSEVEHALGATADPVAAGIPAPRGSTRYPIPRGPGDPPSRYVHTPGGMVRAELGTWVPIEHTDCAVCYHALDRCSHCDTIPIAPVTAEATNHDEDSTVSASLLDAVEAQHEEECNALQVQIVALRQERDEARAMLATSTERLAQMAEERNAQVFLVSRIQRRLCTNKSDASTSEEAINDRIDSLPREARTSLLDQVRAIVDDPSCHLTRGRSWTVATMSVPFLCARLDALRHPEGM